MRTYKFKFLLLSLIFLIYSCGGDSDPSSGTGTGGTGGTGGTTSVAASVTLTANPIIIGVTTGTSSISAAVRDSNGANIPDGTAVTFQTSLGSITPSQATTSNGVALATLQSSTAGTATITGTSGDVSGSVTVTISAADPGSIEFDSATPNVIGIKEFGHTATSLIKFLVKDINGNPVVDGTPVDFVMSGPGGGRLPANGGEYIGDLDTTPTTVSASTVGGEASVYLHSGSVAGPVIIVATVSVSGTTMSSASTPISIGGGVLNDDHFTVASDKFNLEGLAYVNIQANISAYLADRFGNYNVLEGTSVSFYAEAGAIDTSNVTDSTGVTSAAFRTQNPSPEDVAPEAWETTLQNYVNTNYGVLPSGHPRDGWATILVSTKGEEAFDDINENGMYDTGDTFTDTIQEAFIDINDNSSRDDETSTDPFEICIDENENGTCDGVNGLWDSDKTIFKNIRLLITGSPAYILYTPTSFAIANGGSQTFSVLVSDINLNYLIEGTSVSVTADIGKLSGFTSYSFPDVAPATGAYPLELSFTLADSDDADVDPAESAIITIAVTWKGIKYTRYIYGTVD